MVRIRTLASGIAAWVALASTVSAAPVSWFGSQSSLTAWYANQINDTGSVFGTGAGVPLSNLPTNWYAPPPAPAPTPSPTTYGTAVAPSAVAVPSVSRTATYSAPVAAQTTPSYQADAFVNLGAGPYNDSSITTGNARPWYDSPAAAAVFGGTPSASQQASFDQDVLSKVQQTFALSGLDVKVTDDPNVPAPHMMSVVSGASYTGNPDAIGITQVGDSGFSFIDKLNYASNPDQLSWAVAHNVAHEIMHALGVGSHPDTTGNYIDSAAASWDLLTNPNATFSPAAVSLIKSAMANGADVGSLGAEILKAHLLSANGPGGSALDGDQVLAAATPVPEPATIAVWMLGLIGGVVLKRRGRRNS